MRRAGWRPSVAAGIDFLRVVSANAVYGIAAASVQADRCRGPHSPGDFLPELWPRIRASAVFKAATSTSVANPRGGGGLPAPPVEKEDDISR